MAGTRNKAGAKPLTATEMGKLQRWADSDDPAVIKEYYRIMANKGYETPASGATPDLEQMKADFAQRKAKWDEDPMQVIDLDASCKRGMDNRWKREKIRRQDFEKDARLRSVDMRGREEKGYRALPDSDRTFLSRLWETPMIIEHALEDITAIERHAVRTRSRPDFSSLEGVKYGRENMDPAGKFLSLGSGNGFGERMFRRFWEGFGDYPMSRHEFERILGSLERDEEGFIKWDLATKSNGKSYTEKHFERDGKRYTARKMDLYGSDFANAIGSAWITFKDDIPVGLEDTYDFNPKEWGERDYEDEIITSAANIVTKLFGKKARKFSIRYGVVPEQGL